MGFQYFNFITLLVSISLLFASCSKEECSPMNVNITNLEDEYGCVNTPYQMNIDLNQNFTIIRTPSEFNQVVTGSCQPDIDFDKYSLIIGKQGLSNGVSDITYLLSEECNADDYNLTVTFIKNATTEAPNLTWHVLTPHLDDNDQVKVIIEIQ
jgi:hypothetical protein